jgi:hypothetical protein
MIVNATKHKSWAEALERNGWTPALLTGPAFDKFVDDEFASLRAIMAQVGHGYEAPSCRRRSWRRHARARVVLAVGRDADQLGAGYAASARTSCPGWSPLRSRCAAASCLGGAERRLPRDGESRRARRGYWPGFAWVSAGMLLNALLITTSASS